MAKRQTPGELRFGFAETAHDIDAVLVDPPGAHGGEMFDARRAAEFHALQIFTSHRHVAHYCPGPELHGDAIAGDVEWHAGKILSRPFVAEIESTGAHHDGFGLANMDLFF